MSSFPASSLKTFSSVNTTFTWSGATYKAVSDITLKYGYKIQEEAVTGSNTPYLATGVFHGEADIQAIGSSDNQMYNAASATSGIVTTMGMTFFDGDVNVAGSISGRTWTASGKTTTFEQIWQKDNFVKYKLKLILSNEPTVT